MKRVPVVMLLLSAAAAASAQSYDPQRESPRSLIVAPGDPIAYHQTRLRVRALLDAGDGAAALPLAERLAREYPRDGENLILLARAREAAGRHAQAAAAYERAISLLGWNPVASIHGPSNRFVPMIEAAAAHLAAGNRRAALALLRRGVEEHAYPFPGELFGEERLAPLRDDPEFLALVGRPDTSGWSRDEGWRRDIDHLYQTVLRSRPPGRDQPALQEFSRRHEALKRDVPRLSDEQILVGMNAMLAVLRQGHTWLKGLQGSRIDAGMLPVQFMLFPEGLFIIDASDEHRGLIGARVVRIGETSADEAVRRMSAIGSVDGDMQHALDALSLLRRVAFLRGTGTIGAAATAAPLTLQMPDRRTRSVALAPAAWANSGKLAPAPGVPTPLYLRNVAQRHWEQVLPERDAVYAQINNIIDDPDETLPAFGTRLREVLARSGARNLIVDLRHNTGGNTALHRELLRSIIGFSQLPDRRVWLLVGRWTYSAAANLATQIEHLAAPVIVGEPTSECCNFFGDPNPILLPYSRVTGAVSAVRWNLSHDVFDPRREISPDVPVVLTARDHFAGRDPVLDTVFRMIAEAQNSRVSR